MVGQICKPIHKEKRSERWGTMHVPARGSERASLSGHIRDLSNKSHHKTLYNQPHILGSFLCVEYFVIFCQHAWVSSDQTCINFLNWKSFCFTEIVFVGLDGDLYAFHIYQQLIS